MKPKLTLKQACFQGYPESAVYVQIPVGSRNSASRNAYRTSLRPSSLIEPRHPSPKVVSCKRQEPCTIENSKKRCRDATVEEREESTINPNALHPRAPTRAEKGSSAKLPRTHTGPHTNTSHGLVGFVRMILPQVHLRKPCYDFSFL